MPHQKQYYLPTLAKQNIIAQEQRARGRGVLMECKLFESDVCEESEHRRTIFADCIYPEDWLIYGDLPRIELFARTKTEGQVNKEVL